MKKTVKLTGCVQREYARRLLAEAPDGWVMTLAEPNRSLEQNALLWCLLDDIAQQVDWPLNGNLQKLSAEDWKNIAVADLTKEQRLAAGMSGGFVFLGRPTRRMGKREFSDLLELILAFGSEHGVVWSVPAVNPYDRDVA